MLAQGRFPGSHSGGLAAHFAFTDRTGGASAPPYDSLNVADHVGDAVDAVEDNRRRVAASLALPRVVWLRAQHGASVLRVDATATPEAAALEVDSLVTSAPGVGLGALSADCALIALADAAAGIVAVAHCGRPGLVAGVIPAALATMRDAGAVEVSAVIGPTICAGCYEVPAAMRDAVAAVVPEAAARTRTGTPAVDVAAGVESQLRAGGVADVTRVGGCTAEDPALFSYRRDGVTGRLGAVVWLARDTSS